MNYASAKDQVSTQDDVGHTPLRSPPNHRAWEGMTTGEATSARDHQR